MSLPPAAADASLACADASMTPPSSSVPGPARSLPEGSEPTVPRAPSAADVAPASAAIPPASNAVPAPIAETDTSADASGKGEAEEDEEGELDVAVLKRQKVPLEPGFSQLHWLRYVKTHTRRPQKQYTMAQVATHTDPSRSVWTVLRGAVYDITPYLRYHPGGVPLLMKGAGKDCTRMFDAAHAFVNVDMMLAPLKIGVLVAEQ